MVGNDARAFLLGKLLSLVNAGIRDVAYAQAMNPPAGSFQSHAVPRFTVVVAGRKHIAYHDGAATCDRYLPAGSAIFMPPWGWTQPRYDSARQMVGVVFHREYTRYLWSSHDGNSPPHGADAYVHVPVTLQGSAAQLLQTLCLRAKENRGMPTVDIDRDLFLTLVRVSFHHLEQAPSERSSRARATWESVREYLIENSHRQISRASTARAFRLHPNYLSTLVAQQSGDTFAHMLIRLRMERAAELLRSSGVSVEDVAHACGYQDPGYFIKAFRRHHHTTPGRFRAEGGSVADVRPGTPRPPVGKA